VYQAEYSEDAWLMRRNRLSRLARRLLRLLLRLLLHSRAHLSLT
jgi:hypothetical protein